MKTPESKHGELFKTNPSEYPDPDFYTDKNSVQTP